MQSTRFDDFARLFATRRLSGRRIPAEGGQQRRVGQRFDALVLRRSTHTVAGAAQDRDNGLAGEPAPLFELAVLGGGRVGLDALLAPAKPLLLVFTEPRCGPCYDLLPDIAGWQRVYGDRLTIALVSAGAPETNRRMTAEFGISSVLLQAEHEILDAFGLTQLPAAVLITADGRLSGETAYGANAVRKLTAQALGLAMPDTPPSEVSAIGVGQAAPPIRRPDLAGNVVNFARLRGGPTLVLFWSPGCSHCQELVPVIKAYEQTLERPRMVIVSHGPAALNEEAGFASPIVLDDDQAIARTFGTNGTPAALLLDSRGIVATPVARGETGVRSGLQAILALTASATAAD